MAAGGRILGFLDLGENPATVFQITLARLAQMHAAGGTRQQLSADAPLQRRHRAGDTGRRHAQAPRRRREALLLGDGGEDLHFLESVHGLCPSFG
ncbi:hypothetical protein D9M68_972880 [compost metagenome]